MIEARIIDRGRGPEIEGTRITVYDILDYQREGWHRDMIADLFDISSDQVELAMRYIDEHHSEVMAVYETLLKRDARGNPPELQAKIDAGRGHLHAMIRDLHGATNRGAGNGGHSSRH